MSVILSVSLQEIVAPFILKEPLAAPAPAVKLAVAGVLLKSMPPSFAELVMLEVPLGVRRSD